MTVSDEGIALIKSFEGYRGTAYRCAAGKLTIGYGHALQADEPGLAHAHLSEPRAAELLRADMCHYAQGVARALHGRLVTQHQFDALTSFAYNCGEHALAKLVAHLNFPTPDPALVRLRFGQWCHAAGRVLDDLVVRRRKEAALFLQP